MPIKEALLALVSMWPYAAVAFVVALVLTWLTIAFANRHALHAIPNHRSSHDTPTPQLGGIAVAALPLVCLVYFSFRWLSSDQFKNVVVQQLLLFSPIAIGGLIFFGVGLWDDLRPLRPSRKFLGQAIAAVASFLALGLLQAQIPAGHFYHRAPLIAFFVMLWLIGWVNAYNFMDGMNGKAGVFAIFFFVVAIVLLVIQRNEAGGLAHWVMGHYYGADFLFAKDYHPFHLQAADRMLAWYVVLITSILGFLVFNCRPKARIFLGDGGSHFLGFAMAMAALYQSKSLMGPGVSLLVFFILLLPFIYDVALTMVKRIFQGKKFYEAHREHLYQRLMICGMSHMQVLGVCVVTYVLCGVLAVRCVFAETLTGRLFCLLLALCVMGVYTGLVFFKEARGAAKAA